MFCFFIQKTEKKHRVHVLSDSDDKSSSKKDVKVDKSKQAEKKEDKKIVSAKELFGKTPVKRVAAPKVEKKAKSPDEKQKKALLKKVITNFKFIY